ncbi:MAG: glycine--tRNA ligase subunit beta [Candidatus Syntrophosphaera sp.]
MRDFLLEIGVEEMPATHLGLATEFIRDSFISLMREANLTYDSLKVSSTPRRFFLLTSSVQEMQEDVRVNRTGPAKRISFDKNGELLPPALGFLKKNSAKAEDLRIESNEKGDFIALSYVQKGRPAPKILKEWVEELIPRIPFPKTMAWNDPRFQFSRPLRWLCLLWGEELIPFEMAGIPSGNFTYGNRYLGLGRRLEVSKPDDYLDILRENAVLADRNERRETLCRELNNVLGDGELSVVEDPRLVDTVTDLVESPTAVLAEFDDRFLRLPEKIITSTISQNQKYFAVQTGSGSLSNKFVFISNGDPKFNDIIRKGNEKVVIARLEDALWYFQEDTRHPLESFLPRLKDVVFQSKLGTMADKSGRIQSIVAHLCQKLELDEKSAGLALRAAKLCKADLVTTMLGEKEFTKLQGYIGKQYALAAGEPDEVAEGIYEHYMPRGTNDSLPASQTGAIVAVADKLDSVCGIIGIGEVPTGSADPFALRRAANGIVQISVDRGWPLDLSNLIDHALEQAGKMARLSPTAREDVQDFLRQRVQWLLKQMGLDYDVIESVMHLSLGILPRLKQRALALQKYRMREDFLRLVIGYKRAANIIGERKEFPGISTALLIQEEEKKLYEELQILGREIDSCLQKWDYTRAIDLLVSFGTHIDRFFDEVLVNCEDPKLRENRHALLNSVKSEFVKVADISKIVIENDTEVKK